MHISLSRRGLEKQQLDFYPESEAEFQIQHFQPLQIGDPRRSRKVKKNSDSETVLFRAKFYENCVPFLNCFPKTSRSDAPTCE
jgi:hypothetical protein